MSEQLVLLEGDRVGVVDDELEVEIALPAVPEQRVFLDFYGPPAARTLGLEESLEWCEQHGVFADV